MNNIYYYMFLFLPTTFNTYSTLYDYGIFHAEEEKEEEKEEANAAGQ